MVDENFNADKARARKFDIDDEKRGVSTPSSRKKNRDAKENEFNGLREIMDRSDIPKTDTRGNLLKNKKALLHKCF